MSYTPTEWESTDVVTATRMNALEQAVGDMNMSYTPNVWSDGDILSAEKMNALEQAVASGGGGGGSSDFSTAEVTIVNNDEGSYINMPVCLEADEYNPAGIGLAYIGDYATETFTIPLYKGMGFAEVTENVNYSVSGDIEDTGGGWLNITGNGTITIS